MNSFSTLFEIKTSNIKIEHSNSLLFIGSCFSDEISNKASFYGFDTTANLQGTIFHPEVIARNINDALNEGVKLPKRIVERGDLFFSWDTSGSIFGYSESELQNKIDNSFSTLRASLRSASVLFITFGTCWGYRLKASNLVVANCHKQPGVFFDKHLSDIDSLESIWNKTIEGLNKVNPNLKVVFTVSPVRHIKDGLIENNQSKSILIELVRRLENTHGVEYFPSYEIVIDELRDYRFFKRDRVHPNDEAIDYVWGKFMDTYMNKSTVSICTKIVKIKLSEHHRSLYDDSKEHILFKNKITEEKNEFLKQYPGIKI